MGVYNTKIALKGAQAPRGLRKNRSFASAKPGFCTKCALFLFALTREQNKFALHENISFPSSTRRSTDTGDSRPGRSGYVGDHSVALTWPSVGDGRPDQPPSRDREVAGASCRACAESSPQREPTARKCTVRTWFAPPTEESLLGRPFGRSDSPREPSGTAIIGHTYASSAVTRFKYSCGYLGVLETTPGY